MNKFDSFVDKDRFVIVTHEYSEIHGDRVPVHNFISIERARQIVKDLQENIKCFEEYNNIDNDRQK